MTGRPMTGRTATLVVVAAAVAACAGSGRWENPDLPEMAWKHDIAACDARALKQAEDEYARREPLRGLADRWGHGRDFAVRMARYEAELAYGDLFEACMVGRGYRRVDETEAGKAPGEAAE